MSDQNEQTRQTVFHSNPEIMGGTPVFVGTRVPIKNLMDYLEGGHTLEEFLDDFPSVSKKQAIAVLDEATRMLLENARVA